MSNIETPRETIIAQSKQQVKTLSLEMLQAANNRDFAKVASKMFASNLRGFHDKDDDPWSIQSGKSLITFIEDYLRENPDFVMNVLDITVDISDDLNTASVWLLRSDTGCADKVRRETVMWMTWAREGPTWLCTMYEGIRAFPFFTIDALRGGGI